MKKLMKALSMLIVVVVSLNLIAINVMASGDAEELSVVTNLEDGDNEVELTKLEGLILFIRLVGFEEEALSFIVNESTFSDVPEWGKQYVEYAYENGFVEGINENEFGVDIAIESNSYITYVISELGYENEEADFDWDDAMAKSIELGIVDQVTAAEFDIFSSNEEQLVINETTNEEVTLSEFVQEEPFVLSSIVPHFEGTLEDEGFAARIIKNRSITSGD